MIKRTTPPKYILVVLLDYIILTNLVALPTFVILTFT